jgi:excisionase family DNA binding protein
MTEQNLNQVELLTPKEVAAILKVSTKTVERRIADGTIPHIKIGSVVRIPADFLSKMTN